MIFDFVVIILLCLFVNFAGVLIGAFFSEVMCKDNKSICSFCYLFFVVVFFNTLLVFGVLYL